MIEGLVRLMNCDGPQPGPVNLGDPLEITVLALAERILALTGSASRIERRPLPVDDPRRRRPDISLAGARLDWRPTTGLDQGLAATIDWMRGQPASAGEAAGAPALASA